jgi:DNA-binding LytR/AlgR family response regulator
MILPHALMAEGVRMSKGVPTKLRVVIADDEELSRKRIRHLLGTEPQTEIVAECSDGLQTIGAIQEKSPTWSFWT